MRSLLAVQVFHLAQRSIVRTLRQPALVFPSLIFPLFLLAVNSSGLDAATDLPGFPTDSYLTFALALTFMQAAIFSTATAGTNLAEDIESGFLNRLTLTPMRRIALFTGLLAGVFVLGLIQAGVYLTAGITAGATVAAGVPGVLVIVVLAVLIAVGFGGIGLFVALRTRSGEAVQGTFPLFFVLLFLSSMSLPRNLIEHDWFRTVATWNPVSYLIEGFRSLLITGWDGEALAYAFAVAVGLLALSLAASGVALRRTLERT